ncbi:hypothetical protein BOTBODRAFT_27797 [Botryobasidium botryosum FD-172 SS1]|uniref:Dickkopf N-terminal cysteine-rich domain-containing protein n=1 Tax=Botryobasidium botryosum (strain FD-172 SS1) TaxID=930990 RepID=A0A067N500_BOTB1|nr:hypothetical protein BOTBODRAFT_27797 [Botryobasidium botryosum FD-172 SS1]
MRHRFHSFSLLLSVVLFLLLQATLAGHIPTGERCDLSKNGLDHATHKFLSDCNPRAYCARNGTCANKGCRRDEYPFGYEKGQDLPPMCHHGEYCPDEEDACRPLVTLGGACQLNRDDECKPPHNFAVLASPQNFNGSICLASRCHHANVTLGGACVLDNTVYFGRTVAGQEFANLVSRDNCMTPGLYCDPSTLLCSHSKQVGAVCGQDQECASYNCNTDSRCDYTPDTPTKVTFFVYFITGLAVLGIIAIICALLFRVHKRHRRERQREIEEYYRQQTHYRNSIIDLYSQARDQKGAWQ